MASIRPFENSNDTFDQNPLTFVGITMNSDHIHHCKDYRYNITIIIKVINSVIQIHLKGIVNILS